MTETLPHVLAVETGEGFCRPLAEVIGAEALRLCGGVRLFPRLPIQDGDGCEDEGDAKEAGQAYPLVKGQRTDDRGDDRL